MKFLPLLAGLWLALASGCGNPGQLTVTASPTGQLQPWEEDPNYWTWDGKTPELLLGGSSSEALFLEDNFRGEIAVLQKTGGNYLRCTLRTLDDGEMTPFVWTDSTAFFNLLEYREEYWDQLSDMISYAENLGVAVEIVVWDFPNATKANWNMNAWTRPGSEINYDGNPLSKDFLPGENPFFQTVPGAMLYLNDYRFIRPFQEAFVDQLLARTAHFNNVIYNYVVPSNLHIPWMVYWGKYTEAKAEEMGKRVNINVGIAEPQRMDIATFNQTVLSGQPVVAHPAPPNGNGINGLALASIRGIRVVERFFTFKDLSPAPDLFGGVETQASGATDGEGNYLIYMPRAGSVEIYPDVEQHASVRVTVVGYLGTQRSEVLERPYGDSFRLFTEEERGGWMILKGAE
ncbi:hypothetical protein [Neolewinella persica]|uniref:hypothetical protein n=1 Tax=Neolewinella persica TaxID=70998 RepID=UPI00037E8072|nr:hypothetical protein [Neolewinella persica]